MEMDRESKKEVVRLKKKRKKEEKLISRKRKELIRLWFGPGQVQTQ